MKVLVFGGGGVFGSRLARLLTQDGHAITLASRHLGSIEKLAEVLACETLIIDRTGDLSPLLTKELDVVVDAAGPFQNYRDDPYRLASFCVDRGINYLDLSDDATFTEGIAKLDEAAKRRSCFALSGASSVPAVSSAAVTELSGHMEEIDAIDVAILPGNRAPRGRSLIAAILLQAGRPLRFWRGGWVETTAWRYPRRYNVGRGGRRVGRLIGAPDLLLFPEKFRAGAVTFRAGMELGVLNWAVSVFGWLHRRNILSPSKTVVGLAHCASTLLRPLGRDRGAMVVSVIGSEDGALVRRVWRLIAEGGDGPFVPTIPVRALLRRMDSIRPGARPCLGELTLHEILEAAADLRVTSEHLSELPLFKRLLRQKWVDLPDRVQSLHSVLGTGSFEGRARVSRGRNVLAQALAWLFSFPKVTDDIAVRVEIVETDKGETWTRQFGRKRFRSYLSRSLKRGNMVERFGPLSFEIDLQVKEGCLHFPVVRGRALGILLPAALLPRSEAREFELDGKFHFDVALGAPLGLGLMVRYQGYLEPRWTAWDDGTLG